MDWRMSQEREFFLREPVAIRAGSIRLIDRVTLKLSRITPAALRDVAQRCKLANAEHHPTRPGLTASIIDPKLELPLKTDESAESLTEVERSEAWGMGEAEQAWQGEDIKSARRSRKPRSRSRRRPSPPPACPDPPLKDSSGRPYNLRRSPCGDAGPTPSYWTRPQEQGAQSRRSRPSENGAAQPAPRPTSPPPGRKPGASRRSSSRPPESRATQPAPSPSYPPPPQRHGVPRRSLSRPPEHRDTRPPMPPVPPPQAWDPRPPMPPFPPPRARDPRPPMPPFTPPPAWDPRPPRPPFPPPEQGSFLPSAPRQFDNPYRDRRG